MDLSVTRTPPPAKRIVIFKIAGKLYWPALVVAEHDASITVRVFNKNSVVKKCPKKLLKTLTMNTTSITSARTIVSTNKRSVKPEKR